MKKIYLAVLVLLLLSMSVGSYLWLSRQSGGVTSPLQPTATPTSRPLSPTGSFLERDTKQIKATVGSFYQAYQDCMKKPPVAVRGKVSSYCQANTGLTSEDFVENLKQVGTARLGGDPITCSQTPPSSTSADMVDYEAPDKAVVTTVLLFGSGFAQKVPVVVVKEDTVWKVSSVSCPRS